MIINEEDLKELNNTEASNRVNSHEQTKTDEENTNGNDKNTYNCIEINSKVPNINKKSTCDPCVKKKKFRKK